MFPIYPLDGGRIIKGIINIKSGRYKADKYANIISIIVTIILTIFAVMATYCNSNIAIMLIMVYIWILVIKENKISKQKERIYKILQKNT